MHGELDFDLSVFRKTDPTSASPAHLLLLSAVASKGYAIIAVRAGAHTHLPDWQLPVATPCAGYLVAQRSSA